jgi:hypothetical protein
MDARPSTTTRATTAIEEVVPAAMHGRVERLFVALDREAWGDWDSKEGKVRTSADLNGRASDLLDLAAAQTFLHGGVVYAVPVQEMPVRAPVAALLRY